MGSTLPTSLCLLCRQLYRRTGIARYCRQSGERLGECFLQKTKGGGTDRSITNIYSLVGTVRFYSVIFNSVGNPLPRRRYSFKVKTKIARFLRKIIISPMICYNMVYVVITGNQACCGSKYIELGSGSGILAQFGSGSRKFLNTDPIRIRIQSTTLLNTLFVS